MSDRESLRQQLRGYMDVETQDQRVTAQVSGSAVQTAFITAGQGDPLVLLHGANTSSMLWFPVIKSLASRFTVIAPDIVGFGETDKPDAPYDRAYFAAWLHAFLDAAGYERAHLLGLSMGGAIALQFALDHPARVNYLLPVGSGGFGDSKMPVPLALGLVWLHLFPSRAAQNFARRMNKVSAPGEKREALSAYRLAVMKSGGSRRVFFRAAKGVTATLPDESLQKLTMPVRMIWGANDNTFPVNQAERVATVIPDATVTVIPEAGHIPFIEQPQAFSQAVLDVLPG